MYPASVPSSVLIGIATFPRKIPRGAYPQAQGRRVLTGHAKRFYGCMVCVEIVEGSETTFRPLVIGSALAALLQWNGIPNEELCSFLRGATVHQRDEGNHIAPFRYFKGIPDPFAGRNDKRPFAALTGRTLASKLVA